MQRSTGARASWTKAGEALPNEFCPSFVPWKEEIEAHIQAKRRIQTSPSNAITEPISEFIDNTLYAIWPYTYHTIS
jgi:hypothetical protein